jgi:hypothetical protein
MPKYRVTDNITGRSFELTGDSPPTDKELNEVFGTFRQQQQPQPQAGIARPRGFESPTVAGLKGAGQGIVSGIGNIPESAGRVFESLKQIIGSPIETGQLIAESQLGEPSEAAIQDPNSILTGIKGVGQVLTDTAIATGKQIIDDIRNAQERPVEALLGVSSILTGGGAALRAGAQAGKMGNLAKLGTAAQQAGVALDPVNILAKGVRGGTKLGKGVAKTVVGKTTGVGPEVVEQWLQATPDMRAAMRSQLSEAAIASDAQGLLSNIGRKRKAAYQARLAQIEKQKGPIDVTKLGKELNDIESDFRIDIGAPTSDTAAETFRAIEKNVADTLADAQGQTAIALDSLKQRLSRKATDQLTVDKAMYKQMAKSVDDLLVKEVKGYKKMTSEYSEFSEIMDNAERAILGKSSATADTTLKKMMSVMKENPEIRRGVMQELNKLGDTNLNAQVAGVLAKPKLPSGIFGNIVDASLIIGAVSFGMNTQMLGLALMSSPRLMGELLSSVGIVGKKANTIMNALADYRAVLARQGLIQAEKQTRKENNFIKSLSQANRRQ